MDHDAPYQSGVSATGPALCECAWCSTRRHGDSCVWCQAEVTLMVQVGSLHHLSERAVMACAEAAKVQP